MDGYKAQYYEDALQHYDIKGIQYYWKGHRKNRKRARRSAAMKAKIKAIDKQKTKLDKKIAKIDNRLSKKDAKKAGKVGLATASKINSTKKVYKRILRRKEQTAS